MNLDKLDPSLNHFEEQRRHMVQYLRQLGIKDERVLEAMSKVPRQSFLDQVQQQDLAYKNRPLGIGYGQTISQPYIVAYMSEVAAITPTDKALEIGTGSGYQAAILGELAKEVYSIEIVEPLAERAATTQKRLGYSNIFTKSGDGYAGWPEQAPFDVIILTACPPKLPQPLLQQLQIKGKLIAPVGVEEQQIFCWTKVSNENFVKESFLPVRFVPMTGKAQSLHNN